MDKAVRGLSFLPSFSSSIFSVTHSPYTAQQFKGKPELTLFPMSDIHSALTETMAGNYSSVPCESLPCQPLYAKPGQVDSNHHQMPETESLHLLPVPGALSLSPF